MSQTIRIEDTTIKALTDRIAELEKCGEHRQDIIEILEGRVEELGAEVATKAMQLSGLSYLYDETVEANARLSARIHEACEVYAGMDGFIPETAPEAYCLRIIDQVNKALLGGGE